MPTTDLLSLADLLGQQHATNTATRTHCRHPVVDKGEMQQILRSEFAEAKKSIRDLILLYGMNDEFLPAAEHGFAKAATNSLNQAADGP